VCLYLDPMKKREILPLPEIELRPSSPSLRRLSYPDCRYFSYAFTYEDYITVVNMKQALRDPYPYLMV
jgi:hypothetical protein